MSLIRDGILLFDNFYNKANEFNNRLVDMSGDRNILFFLSHSESINSSNSSMTVSYITLLNDVKFLQ